MLRQLLLGLGAVFVLVIAGAAFYKGMYQKRNPAKNRFLKEGEIPVEE